MQGVLEKSIIYFYVNKMFIIFEKTNKDAIQLHSMAMATIYR